MNRPYLDFRLDLGFLAVRTEVARIAFHTDEFNYILLAFQFFKWSGVFRLYEPGRERMRRLAAKRAAKERM